MPPARVICDPCHLVRHLGDALDAVRRREYLSRDGRRSLANRLKANTRLNTASLRTESLGQLGGCQPEGEPAPSSSDGNSGARPTKRARRGSTATGTASPRTVTRRAPSASASWRGATTRSVFSSGGPTATVMRPTSTSQSSRPSGLREPECRKRPTVTRREPDFFTIPLFSA